MYQEGHVPEAKSLVLEHLAVSLLPYFPHDIDQGTAKTSTVLLVCAYEACIPPIRNVLLCPSGYSAHNVLEGL